MNIKTDFVFIILAILVFYGIKYKVGLNNFHNDYLSLSQSNVLKGLFALVVVLHHLCQAIVSYLPNTSKLFKLFLYAGPWAVMIFFFLSGYGVQTKWIKDSNYKNGFLRKRLKSIIPLYLLANIVYIVVYLIFNIDFKFANIFTQFITGSLIVNNSWFVVVIIAFYICHYFLMKIFDRDFNKIVISSFGLCSMWILTNRLIFTQYGLWWSNYIYALWLGILWATYEKKILVVIKKYYWLVLSVSTISLFLVTFKIAIKGSIFIQSFLFPLMVITFVMKFKIDNKILQYLGKISFEIYLFHGIFVNRILRTPDLICANDGLLYIVISFVLSLILATIIHYLFLKIRMVIDKSMKKLIVKR